MTQHQKNRQQAELRRAYEDVRRIVLEEPEAHSRNPYGLALILYQGLAVWMHTWTSCLASMEEDATLDVPSSRQPAESENMQEIRSEVVSIMTTMILAQSRKEHAHDSAHNA